MPITTVIDAQVLDNSANVLSAEFNNDHVKLVDLEISWPIPAQALGASTFKVYVLTSLDGGVTFEDGAAGVDPEEGSEVHTFMIRNENIARTMVAKDIPLPSAQYKYLLQSDTNKVATVTLKELLQEA